MCLALPPHFLLSIPYMTSLYFDFSLVPCTSYVLGGVMSENKKQFQILNASAVEWAHGFFLYAKSCGMKRKMVQWIWREWAFLQKKEKSTVRSYEFEVWEKSEGVKNESKVKNFQFHCLKSFLLLFFIRYSFLYQYPYMLLHRTKYRRAVCMKSFKNNIGVL